MGGAVGGTTTAAEAGAASLPNGGGGGSACGLRYCGTKYAAAPATRTTEVIRPQFGPRRRRRYVYRNDPPCVSVGRRPPACAPLDSADSRSVHKECQTGHAGK